MKRKGLKEREKERRAKCGAEPEDGRVQSAVE